MSNLVDNVTKRLQNDKYTDCKSCLDYISIKNNQLFFRRFDGKKNYKKYFNKDSQIYMNFVIKTLINLFCYYFVYPWVAGKDLMKHYYLRKKIFIVA